MVSDNNQYMMETATFVGMGHRETASGPPCHCGCNGGSASFGGFDANNVRLASRRPAVVRTCAECLIRAAEVALMQTFG
jgi:hypothetical protein